MIENISKEEIIHRNSEVAINLAFKKTTEKRRIVSPKRDKCNPALFDSQARSKAKQEEKPSKVPKVLYVEAYHLSRGAKTLTSSQSN